MTPEAATVVVVGASEAEYERLAEGLAGHYHVQCYADSEALCRALDDDSAMADVIVFSRLLPRPFSAASSVLPRTRDAALLILCRPQDEQNYARRLHVTPHMDRRVELLPTVDNAELPEWVCRLGRKVRQRRGYRRTLAAAQRQLDNDEQPRRPANHYLEQLLEHLPVGILNVDSQGRAQSFNRAARELLAMTGEPAPDTPALDLFSPPQRQVVADLLAESNTGSSARRHVTLEDADRGRRVIELSKSPVADYGGEPIVILMLQDVTDMQNALEHMSHNASHDTLTGLINRREFQARLEMALETARRRNDRHVLCYMDLDGFKTVNDSAGHQAGDEMLRQVAELMKRSCRERDFLARWGGDEFVLLLEHCAINDAERVARVLLDQVTSFDFEWQGRIYRVGISIGIAPVGCDAQRIDQVLTAADEACYTAKRQGGNRVHVRD